jgi:hypothetical protein
MGAPCLARYVLEARRVAIQQQIANAVNRDVRTPNRSAAPVARELSWAFLRIPRDGILPAQRRRARERQGNKQWPSHAIPSSKIVICECYRVLKGGLWPGGCPTPD